jgi:hypothetical protein
MEQAASLFQLVYSNECFLFSQILPFMFLAYERHPLHDDRVLCQLIPVMELVHMIYLSLDNNINIQQMKNFLHIQREDGVKVNILVQAKNRIYRTMETFFNADGWDIAIMLNIPDNAPWQPQLRTAARKLMQWSNFNTVKTQFSDAWSCLRSTIAVAMEVRAMCLTCKQAHLNLRAQLLQIRSAIDDSSIPAFLPFMIRLQRFTEERPPFWPDLLATRQAFIQTFHADLSHTVQYPRLPIGQANIIIA